MRREIIIIATVKSWNIAHAGILQEELKNEYEIITITDKDDLLLEDLEDIHPSFIFFPHWSWVIPENIYSRFECIIFHMTDLPYGRGGSPLQNLIMRKQYETKITAAEVTKDLDSGDVYLKEDLFIGRGSAEDIYKLASCIIFFRMIPHIIREGIHPVPQNGEIVPFKRRLPEESKMDLRKKVGIVDVYDFIRMLDAEGYQKAYLEFEKLKIQFSNIQPVDDKLEGRFEILKK